MSIGSRSRSSSPDSGAELPSYIPSSPPSGSRPQAACTSTDPELRGRHIGVFGASRLPDTSALEELARLQLEKIEAEDDVRVRVEDEEAEGEWPTAFRLWVDAAPGCGGLTWPAAWVLSGYLAWLVTEEGEKVHGLDMASRRVLELGSGTGAVGIVLALLLRAQQERESVNKDRKGKGKVVISDLSEMMQLMADNVALNGLEDDVEVLKLPWGNALPSEVTGEGKPTLILLADAVYLEITFPLLVTTLVDLTARNPQRAAEEEVKVLFCYQKRRKADKRFFTLAKKHFDFVPVKDDPKYAKYERKPIYLYWMKRKR